MGETYETYTDLNTSICDSAKGKYLGTNKSYYDTKFNPFESHRDFVFAMDYSMDPVDDKYTGGVLCSAHG